MSRATVGMTDLPMEMVSHILSFLDAESLFSFAGVNEHWDEITNYLSPKVWFKACVKADIRVKKDKFQSTSDWKAFLSSMLQRKVAMRKSDCFSTICYRMNEPIQTLYCYNEKVALALSNRVEIWNMAELTILNEFQCRIEPLYLKFDDSILLAASREGIVLSWSTTTGNSLRTYSNTRWHSILSSFDFLTGHDIAAASFLRYNDFTNSIHIWSMSSDNVVIMEITDQNLIGQVMLAPNRDLPVEQEEVTCHLFSLTFEYVLLWTVHFQNQILFAHISNTFHIPPNPFPQFLPRTVIGNMPWGLLFDGKALYVMSRYPENSSRIIWTVNFNMEELRYLENDQRVINLLGVGEKYIVYEVKINDTLKCIFAAHKVTSEIVAIIREPSRKNILVNHDHLCLGNLSWLDGLDGENDSGIVYVSISDDRLGLYVTQFTPRIR